MSQKICTRKDCAYCKLGTCKFAQKASPKAEHRKPKRGTSQAKKLSGAKLAPMTTVKAILKHIAPVNKLKQNLERASSLIKGYVKVDSKDSKSVSWADSEEVASLQDQLSFLKAAARSAVGGQHIRIKLFVSTIVTSGVNSAIAGFFGVIPSQSAEWASLITLYDEVRVDSVDVMHTAGVTVTPTVSVGAGVIPYAIGYDPTYNTTPGSLEDVQESEYSQLKLAPASSGFDKPAAVPTGFHVLHVKIPHTGAVMNEDMKTKPNFPGSWMSCLDTADAVGYLRYYVPTLGAAGQSSIRIHYVAHCEFRIRT